MSDRTKHHPTASPQQQPSGIGLKAEPIPMTQEEIEAMAAGGSEAEAVARRLERYESTGRQVAPEERASKQLPTLQPPQQE